MRGTSMEVMIAVVTDIVAMSTVSIFIKLCDVHPLVIAFYLLGLPPLILAPIALRHRRYGKILPGDGDYSSSRAFILVFISSSGSSR